MLATMPSTLTAQIFDETTGQPASGVRVQLYWVEARGDVLLRAGSTNDAGSTDQPLLDPTKMSAGTYKLVLHLGDYFERSANDVPVRFLDVVPVVFVIDDASRNAHVRVSVSPTTYQVARIDAE
jgi:5-hydroxyisourate hydrolase